MTRSDPKPPGEGAAVKALARIIDEVRLSTET